MKLRIPAGWRILKLLSSKGFPIYSGSRETLDILCDWNISKSQGPGPNSAFDIR